MKKLAALSLTAIALSVSFSVSANQPKTLVYCSEASPTSFNPQLVTDGASIDASGQTMYNRLTEFERGKTTVQPSLAEKWEVSDDGKVYTFHLRKGVKFQSNKNFKPTRDFNADDVIFSFDRQMNKDNPFHSISNLGYEYFVGMDMPNIIDKLEKVDDYTVKIYLKQANAPFLANIAMDFAGILSAEYAENMLKAGTPEKIDQDPIGTGPFELVNYQKDATIRYKAFDDYWKGKSKIDRLVFSITPDASVRYAKLQKGECHIMPYPNPADLDLMRKRSGNQRNGRGWIKCGLCSF